MSSSHSTSPTLYSYVVVFDGVTVPEFTRTIDRKLKKAVRNWFSVLPQCVFVVSALSASDLCDRLREEVPDLKRVLVLDADTDRNGWIPQSAWEFLRRPRPAT